MFGSLLTYFTDPVLRAPTIGCMLMCFSASLIGVIVFLKKQSLLGESLSHSAYPGVILGAIFAGILELNEEQDTLIAFLIMSGAFISSLVGLWTINFLERRLKVRSDSALCFVLSVFFGLGMTLASQVQFSYTSLYRKIQIYLYGQAATMSDAHIAIYGVLSLLIVVAVFSVYKELQTIAFDHTYAKSIGIPTRAIDAMIFILIVLAVVIGIRSVGVVLMSAMLIAPAVASRQFSHKLYVILMMSAFFGLVSGFFGNYFSVEISRLLAIKYPNARLSLPTGPMIVLVASTICLLSLMFAPERGLLLRLFRIASFRYHCLCENILKAIWRFDKEEVSFDEIARHQSISALYLRFILSRLVNNGWVDRTKQENYRLTSEGKLWASKIVRLHRLWEVYLADYLGVGISRVHRSAEEMEHIITPELERELTLLLKDPKKDPHQQPIPSREV